jgi:hypothetical protein
VDDELDDSITGIYCKEGHIGPLWEVCVDSKSYLDDFNGDCIKCPQSSIVIARLLGIFIGADLTKRKVSNYVSSFDFKAKPFVPH